MRMRKCVLMLAIVLSMLPASAFAQRTNAAVRGTVTDPSKAVVPGATVTITGTDTGLTRTTVTNADGVYSVSELPVGRYTISVELQGFKTATRTDIALNVADDRKIDFELAPGALTETVSVEAESTPVKTHRWRRLGRHHRRAGPRAAAQRPQLPAARDADAGRQRAGLPQRQGQGAARRLRPLGQRRRRDRQPLDGRRREQQRRRLEPHDPRLPVGRRDRGVQDPAQQLRRRVRPGRRRADQHRHPQRHEQVHTAAPSTSAATTR